MIFYVIKQMKEGKSIEEIKKSKGGEATIIAAYWSERE